MADTAENKREYTTTQKKFGYNRTISVFHEKNMLTMGHTTILIGMEVFKQFAGWYLEEQEIK